ncbi:hypothetical protein MYCTH_2114650 [Thermothelomyces thermophilus ATCC 42464]|uniref:DNA mismatch repair protein MSH3 n=1 Tax=Thermothelomyces thermophilus (strain ATCC 42464 / BCRC 31852 / DSM 1799) TaxID=573729 RepID=G2Q500_THET4|nr:uncharacterized protein MYCTH_2114650 [Thermothelomyces thermophilus ATCC 42464]AEO53737.1 hypothetical protein MYCTH_2114650 [Thermothelomyces thermophilus ATCC 42464]
MALSTDSGTSASETECGTFPFAATRATEAPYHSRSSRKSTRPGTDWLRRRAMSGAARNTMVSVEATDSLFSMEEDAVPSALPKLPTRFPIIPQQRYPYNKNALSSDSSRGPSNPTTSSPVNNEASARTPTLPPSSASHDPHPFNNSGPACASSSQKRRQSLTPTLPRYSPLNSSPPVVIGDPALWLLPRPFHAAGGIPSVEGTPSGKPDGNRASSGISIISSVAPFGDKGQSSEAETPTSLGSEKSDNSVLRSPYFRKRASEAALVHGEKQAGNLPSDPFIAARSDHLSRHSIFGPARQYQQHDEMSLSAMSDDCTSPEHHHSMSYNQVAEFSAYSSPVASHTRLGASEPRSHHGSASGYAYGPSVMSWPVTQTITPNTSPYRRAKNEMSPTSSVAENTTPNGLDFDLSSDSETDDESVNTYALAPRRRQHVTQPEQSRTISEFLDDQDCVMCAVSESRSSDMMGVAIINMTLGQVDLIRIINDNRYRRLAETLWRMPTQPQIFIVLKKVVDEHNKEYWNESEGLRLLDRFAWRTHVKAIRSDLEHNFYVSCALSALMAYVEEEMNVIFKENSLRLQYRQPADTMGLDRSTITSLELFQNIRNVKGTSSTLFGLLNNALTPQGRRMIRSTLLQPSTRRETITARLEAVEELSSNENLFIDVRSSLKRMFHIDVERAIPWSRLALEAGVALVQGHHQIIMPSHDELLGAEKDVNRILMIKAYLTGVQAIRETLEAAGCTSQLCKWVLERCQPENTAPIDRLISEGIEPGAVYSKAPIDIRNNRMWAFRAEPNSILDGARQLYRDRVNELHKYVEELNKVFQEHLGATPELRFGNDNHYFLRFQWSDVERELIKNLPATNQSRQAGTQHWRPRLLGGVEIVNGVRRKRHYDCQTLELIQRSSQIQRQADIVISHSDKFIVELGTSLLEHVESLLAVNEAVAVLDMLWSFAHLATTQNYVRPIISDNLVLKDARHPVVEVRKKTYVPNDVYLGNQGARFQVVTGENMSGKSTFIRTVALIQIMVQIGSFVPATYAALPICDRLFTRLSTEDKPQSNLGTFAVEMTEMNMILRQATKDSMIIVDELGRGTSTKEGLGIALAMSEELIKRGCRVFFATHFTELAKVLNLTRPNSVLNVHVVGESIKEGDITQISLPHTIAPGPVRNEDYGLELSRRFLPQRVVNNAEHICKFLRTKSLGRSAGPATRTLKQSKLILALPDLLKQANDSTMDESALASYLRKLQTEFTIRMNLTAEESSEQEQTGKGTAQHVMVPILEKPSENELEEWKKKSDSAERRVMNANMTESQENKRPGLEGEGDGSLAKRARTGDETASMTSQMTPIDRSLMIEELRRRSHTVTTKAATPSSLSSNSLESQADTEMPEAPSL